MSQPLDHGSLSHSFSHLSVGGFILAIIFFSACSQITIRSQTQDSHSGTNLYRGDIRTQDHGFPSHSFRHLSVIHQNIYIRNIFEVLNTSRIGYYYLCENLSPDFSPYFRFITFLIFTIEKITFS